MKDKEIFLCFNGRKELWKKGSDALKGTKEQRLIFDEVYFLQDGIMIENQIDDNNTGNIDFCQSLGVIIGLPIKNSTCNYPRGDLIIPDSAIEKYRVPTDIYSKWWLSNCFYIDDFEECLKRIDNQDKSIALVELLKSIPEKYLKDEISGTYANGTSAHVAQKVPAKYLRKLENIAWICTKEGFKKPYELSTADFVKLYGLIGNEPFISLIGLRPDYIDSLPEKEKRGAKLFGNCSDAEIDLVEKYLEQLRESQGQKGVLSTHYEITVSKDEILKLYPALDGKIREAGQENMTPMSDARIFGTASSGITHHSGGSSSSNYHATSNAKNHEQNRDEPFSNEQSLDSPESIAKSKALKKALGDLGEERVFDYLKEKYSDEEVNWFGNDNKGYDFTISEDGEDIVYVEAKTTTKKSGRIPMTPSEWNWARLQGDKYDLYILNASTGAFQIVNNPFEKYLNKEINIEVGAVII